MCIHKRQAHNLLFNPLTVPIKFIYNSDLLSFLLCEINRTSTPVSYATFIIYELELTPSENKIGFNMLDGNEFTTPYILDTVTNSPSVCKLPTQAKNNVLIVSINGE